MTKKFKVHVQYTFSGYYVVKADSRDEAEEIALRDCGMVMGGSVNSSNDEEVIEWDFDMHPEATVSAVVRSS